MASVVKRSVPLCIAASLILTAFVYMAHGKIVAVHSSSINIEGNQ